MQAHMPSGDRIIEELSKSKSMDDFFGKGGIFARLFAQTVEAMLEAEMSEHLGYEAYEAKGRNSGNSRNGHRRKTVRTSGGVDMTIEVPRDRNSSFEPQIVRKYETSSNEIEDKILTIYGKGMSTRDITATPTRDGGECSNHHQHHQQNHAAGRAVPEPPTRSCIWMGLTSI
jgi:transposase-like protein